MQVALVPDKIIHKQMLVSCLRVNQFHIPSEIKTVDFLCDEHFVLIQF